MVLKATVQKQKSKQWLSKVGLETAVRRCSSKYMLFLTKFRKGLQYTCFPVNIVKFFREIYFI